jgi:predicted DNA-binding protein (UPF0251 family)
VRPKKTRWIKCHPGERCFRPTTTGATSSRERAGSTYFRPRYRPKKNLQGVIVTLDEFEALRLCDLRKLDQHAIALKMKVHRSTVSRILASARAKISDALVNLKAIKIEGGCCEVRKRS